jgi:GNAT superfamily N-acetyltransferase
LLHWLTRTVSEQGLARLELRTNSYTPGGERFVGRFTNFCIEERRIQEVNIREINPQWLQQWTTQPNDRGYSLDFHEGNYLKRDWDAIAVLLSGEHQHYQGSAIAAHDQNLFSKLQHRITAMARYHGELIGYSEVAWPIARPTAVIQRHTAVLPTHRRQGIGHWMKSSMVEHLCKHYPQAQLIRIENTVAAMRKINAEMGFQGDAIKKVWEFDVATLQTELSAVLGHNSSEPYNESGGAQK